MKIRLVLVVTLYLFIVVVSTAQNDDKKIKTEVEIIDFGEDNDENKPFDNLYILKTNPVSLINGIQFVELERTFNDQFSVQVGIGATFGRSYLAVSEIIRGDWIDINLDNKVGTKTGLYFSGGAKYYFAEESPDGIYAALIATYAKRNLEIEDMRFSGAFIDMVELESVKNTSVTLRFGYQLLHTVLVSEFFTEIGIEFQKGRAQKAIHEFNPLFDKIMMEDINRRVLTIGLGVRLGFQFYRK